MSKSLKFQDHISRYKTLIEDSIVLEEYESKADRIIESMIKNKLRYQAVAKDTQVPWQLIACIHNKESSMRFDRHLHNGQPLSMVTTIVPKGRGPFSKWESSASDALTLKYRLVHLLNVTSDEWTLEQCLWFAESYNGWGYFLHHGFINSPYLWCGTSAYSAGGYPSDGKFDLYHVVKNTGVATILLRLLDLELLDLSYKNFDDHQIDVRLTYEELNNSIHSDDYNREVGQT